MYLYMMLTVGKNIFDVIGWRAGDDSQGGPALPQDPPTG